MILTRRQFSFMAGAALLPTAWAGQEAAKPLTLVLAPCNLGLRPTESGGQPGTWRAPQVLMDAGLSGAVHAQRVISLPRPAYEFTAQSDTRIRNGLTLRAFSLELANRVRSILDEGGFPVVIGGDCSVLLGSLYGCRLVGGRGLVHVDGHSDFSHPGNYDATKVLGAAAGMDLALASGRGEALLTQWPQVDGPLAADADIVQIGERNTGKPIFNQYYGDILRTQIARFTVQAVLKEGIDGATRNVIARLEERGLSQAWVHVDLDVLDQAVMPAVDSPGAPGFDYEQLSRLVGTLCASERILGVDFAIYDPELDPDRRYARQLVQCIAESVRGRA